MKSVINSMSEMWYKHAFKLLPKYAKCLNKGMKNTNSC